MVGGRTFWQPFIFHGSQHFGKCRLDKTVGYQRSDIKAKSGLDIFRHLLKLEVAWVTCILEKVPPTF